MAGSLTMSSNMNVRPQLLLVTRVYVDGRPDELVRGLNFGNDNDLPFLNNILATADDPTTFNGFCGGVSGPIPASATSPSLLLQTLGLRATAENTQSVKPHSDGTTK